MVLAFPEGAWGELLPYSELKCESDHAKGYEWHLRSKIYTWENQEDDNPIENTYQSPIIIHNSAGDLSLKELIQNNQKELLQVFIKVSNISCIDFV